nr:MAG TPA: hypothetical protein [Caudoviricetes sp.]
MCEASHVHPDGESDLSLELWFSLLVKSRSPLAVRFRPRPLNSAQRSVFAGAVGFPSCDAAHSVPSSKQTRR